MTAVPYLHLATISAPRTAKSTPPLHQSSQQYTYYRLDSAILPVVIPTRPSSRHPTWPHARNIFCMDPTHHKLMRCTRCSRVSDFGWARAAVLHHKPPFLTWPEHHHLLTHVANAYHRWRWGSGLPCLHPLVYIARTSNFELIEPFTPRCPLRPTKRSMVRLSKV